MLLPPQNLTAKMSSGAILVTWNVAAGSDTPTQTTLTITNGVKSLQQTSPGDPIKFTASPSEFTGTEVAIYVAFAQTTLGESAIAATNLLVPGTAPPTPPASSSPSTSVAKPILLAVNPEPATHSVNFHWVPQGPEGALHSYDKILVLWGRAGAPLDMLQQIELAGTATNITLGPIYPNTAYQFSVEGGVSQGIFGGYNYSGWATLNWVSPQGSMPNVGWLNGWFPVEPGAALQPANPSLPPSKNITAVWRDGPSDLHLDLFLAGGIPTLGVTWSAWWQPNTGWQPWFNVSDAAWKPGVSIKPGVAVTALWRPNSQHLDLFATATDGTVWSTWWEAGPGWQPWFAIHPETRVRPGAPVTAVWRSNGTHLDLFATAASGNIGMVWSTWWEATPGWQPWFTVSDAVWSPGVSVEPGAAVTALWSGTDMHLDLFATANDGSVWSTWWEPTPGWQKWFSIGLPYKLAPGAPITALWSSTGVLEIFGTLADGTPVTAWWEPTPGWHSWVSFPIKLSAGAVLSVSLGSGVGWTLWLIGTSSDGVVWCTTRTDLNPTGLWNAWTAVHPETAMAPGAAIAALWRPIDPQGTPHLDLFARRADASVWSIWYEPSYWS
jgi:hypothetical protein